MQYRNWKSPILNSCHHIKIYQLTRSNQDHSYDIMTHMDVIKLDIHCNETVLYKSYLTDIDLVIDVCLQITFVTPILPKPHLDSWWLWKG